MAVYSIDRPWKYLNRPKSGHSTEDKSRHRSKAQEESLRYKLALLEDQGNSQWFHLSSEDQEDAWQGM